MAKAGASTGSMAMASVYCVYVESVFTVMGEQIGERATLKLVQRVQFS
jgi:hypothetical protein